MLCGINGLGAAREPGIEGSELIGAAERLWWQWFCVARETVVAVGGSGLVWCGVVVQRNHSGFSDLRVVG